MDETKRAGQGGSARVGFIGLGNMGKPMAMNLLKAYHRVEVHDIDERKMEELKKSGGIPRRSPLEMALSADVIFLSLPGPVNVQQVVLGENGLSGGLRSGQVLIDTSTSLPSVSRDIAEKIKRHGADFLDACLGSPPAEVAAQAATFIVGGDAAVLEKVRVLLEASAKKIFHLGPVGAGNTAKLINNLLAHTNTACFIEGLILGAKAGVDLQTLYEVICSSGGASIQFQRKVPRILKRNFTPFFALDWVYKDLNLATTLAQELKTPVFLGSVAKGLFEMARAKGLGDEDNIALVKVLEELNDVRIGG